MATFDDLPPEMVCAVLRHLSLGEMAKNRLVCKRWNELISSSIKVSRVFVDKKRRRPRNGKKSCSNGTMIGREHELCDPGLFVLQCQRAILSRLSCLVINCELPKFNLNQLNAFTELICLMIDLHLSSSYDLALKFSKLEFLSFGWINVEARLSIDCPKLSYLRYDEESSAQLLELKHPQTITTFNGSFHLNFLARLSQLTNVECLKSRSYLVLSEAILLSLPKLKMLKYDDSVCKLLNSGGFALREFGDQMKQMLRALLSKRRELRRFDMKIVIASIVLTDEVVERMDLRVISYSRLFQFDLTMVSNEHLYLSCYDVLMENVSEVPRDFFVRFPNISYLGSGRSHVQNPQHLVWLVNSLSSLRTLKLYSNSGNLTQEFYDKLRTPSLKSFELEETCEQMQLNFQFIGNFRELTIFSINQELLLLSVVSLFRSLRHLDQLDSGGFKFQSKCFKIKRQVSSGKYDLYKDFKKLRINNADLNKIVNYFCFSLLNV